MLDFLKECGISDTTINLLNQKYPAELFDLNCNKKEIIKIIDYFRNIGINNIDELLIYETMIFYKTFDFIKDKFSKYDFLDLVSKINDNYEEIEIILS